VIAGGDGYDSIPNSSAVVGFDARQAKGHELATHGGRSGGIKCCQDLEADGCEAPGVSIS
jgi:hypothetical protein